MRPSSFSVNVTCVDWPSEPPFILLEMLRRRAARSSGPEPESLDCPPDTPDNREMRDSPTAPLTDGTDQEVEDHTANM